MELHQAVLQQQEEVALGYLDQGYDPNALDSRGNGALHLAAATGQTTLIHQLIEKGGHPNLLTHLSQTPLHFAALYGQTDAAMLLMERGADPALVDAAGRTPWAIANAKGFEDLAREILPVPSPPPAMSSPQQPFMTGLEAVSLEETAKPPKKKLFSFSLPFGKGKKEPATEEKTPKKGKKKPHSPVQRALRTGGLVLALVVLGFHGWAFQVKGQYAKRTKDAQAALDTADKFVRESQLDESFALQDYLNAINIDPDFPDAYYKASKAYALMGASDDAIAYQKQGDEARDRAAQNSNLSKLALKLFMSILPGQGKKAAPPPNAPLPGGAPPADAGIPGNTPLGGGAPAPAPEPGPVVSSSALAAEVSPSAQVKVETLSQSKKTKKDWKYYNNAGEIAQYMGLLDNALENFNKSIELNPNNAGALFRRGAIESVLKKPMEAKSDLDRAAILDPKNPKIFSIRGSVFFDLKNYKQAIVDSDYAISLDPKNSISFLVRCGAKASLNDLDGALPDCNQAIILDPKNPGAYIVRGAIREAKGDPGGKEDQKRGEQLSPKQENRRTK